MMGFRFSARRRAKDAQQPTFAHQRRESFLRGTGATLEALIAAFCRLDKLLSGCWEKGWLVGAVGIGLKAVLKTRKLLILLNERNAKNTGFAQVRYTRGTRGLTRFRLLWTNHKKRE
jgi:hypothetical protein